MTTEKIYEVVYNHAKTIDGFELLLKEFREDEACKVCVDEHALIKLVADLERQIKSENNKRNGFAKIESVAKKIVKSSNDEAYKGAFYYNDKQFFCNGYMVLALKKHIDFISSKREDLSERISGFIDSAEENTMLVSLPTIGELKAYIKLQKAQAGKKASDIRYDFGEDDFGEVLPLVQANPLLWILEALPEATTCRMSFNSPSKSAIYFESEEAQALLLPVTIRR